MIGICQELHQVIWFVFSGVVRLGWHAGGLYNDANFWGVATHQGDAGEMRGYWGKSIEEEL